MEMEEFIAWIRHIAWCGFQVAAGQSFNVKPTDEQWESLLRGVEFALNHPGITPEQSHESWMVGRLEQGWKHGERIDTLAKTHPNMLPFGQLPEMERKKDLVGIMAHNLGLKLWGKVQADVNFTKEDILKLVQRIKGLGPTAEHERGMVTAPLPTEPRPRGKYLRCPTCKSPMKRVPNFGHECEECDRRVSDAELASVTPEVYASYLSDRPPKKVAPMPFVDPADAAPGPSCKPLKVKPLLGGVDGTKNIREPVIARQAGREPGTVSMGDKMRKYRCAVFLQHRMSNDPAQDRVLIEVQILHGKREHPTEPAIVIEAHALSERQARDEVLDLFRSLTSMKAIIENGGIDKP